MAGIFFDIGFGWLKDIFGISSGAGGRLPEELRADWETGFTTSEEFSLHPNFRYLVHGLQSPGNRAIQMVALLQDDSAKRAPPHEKVDLLKNPMNVSGKKLISTSCIDQDHLDTFGDVGLILQTPFENVLNMCTEDAGTNFFTPDKTLKKSLKHRKLMPLDDLMGQTGHGYNEIVLTGTTSAGSVKVVGFFIKVRKDGTPADPEMAEQIEILAARYHLPVKKFAARIFPLPDQGVQMEWSTSAHDSPPLGISFNKNKLRYWISMDDNRISSFTVGDEEAKSRLMTKTEAIMALQRAEEELPADQLSLVAEKLQKLREKIPELPDNVQEAGGLSGAGEKPFFTRGSFLKEPPREIDMSRFKDIIKLK